MNGFQRDRIVRFLRPLALSLVALVLAACVVVPVSGPPAVSGFERSFQAAGAAMQDSGLAVTQQDRSTGTIVGSRGNTEVVAQLREEAGGGVRVEFTSRRSNNEDPGLISRVTSAYQQRMGR